MTSVAGITSLDTKVIRKIAALEVERRTLLEPSGMTESDHGGLENRNMRERVG